MLAHPEYNPRVHPSGYEARSVWEPLQRRNNFRVYVQVLDTHASLEPQSVCADVRTINHLSHLRLPNFNDLVCAGKQGLVIR